jgi:hypothetical protein
MLIAGVGLGIILVSVSVIGLAGAHAGEVGDRFVHGVLAVRAGACDGVPAGFLRLGDRGHQRT